MYSHGEFGSHGVSIYIQAVPFSVYSDWNYHWDVDVVGVDPIMFVDQIMSDDGWVYLLTSPTKPRSTSTSRPLLVVVL